jgi:predicted amidophosphoribosyltransferase
MFAFQCPTCRGFDTWQRRTCWHCGGAMSFDALDQPCYRYDEIDLTRLRTLARNLRDAAGLCAAFELGARFGAAEMTETYVHREWFPGSGVAAQPWRHDARAWGAP